MPAYDDFCASYPREVDKISRDLALRTPPPPCLFDQFCSYLNASAPGADLGKEADIFFGEHSLRGEEVARTANDIHGHFCKGSSLEIALSISLSNSDGDDLSSQVAADLIQELVSASRNNSSDFDLIVSSKIGTRPIRTGSRMFSFQDQDSLAAPFGVGPPELLLKRLALPDDPEPKGTGPAPDYLPYTFHYFAFEPPAQVRRPTAFDAGMRCLPVWEPGGMTSPPPPLSGLSEFVHEPVLGVTLRRPFDHFD